MSKISIKQYSTRIIKRKIFLEEEHNDDDDYFEVRGLNTNDLIELFAERTEIMKFIFEGVDFEKASNEQLVDILIKRGFDITLLAISVAAEEPENYQFFRNLPTLVIIKAIKEIIDLTLPKSARELTDEVGKIKAILKNFSNIMKS